MPKSCERCVTSLSVSSNVPSSSRNSIRSRAFILPSLCCRSRRSVLRRDGRVSSVPEAFVRGSWWRDYRRGIAVVDGGRAGVSPVSFYPRTMRGRGRTRLHRSKLLHGRSQRLILILLAIPKDCGNCPFALPRFLGINRHYGFLAHGQLLHRKLLKGEIDDNKLSFGLGRTPAVRPCAVNDQQCQATPLRIFWCELCCNLGIAVPEKRIVRIDHLVIAFGLSQQRVGAARHNHNVFHASAVQIRRHRLRTRYQLAT